MRCTSKYRHQIHYDYFIFSKPHLVGDWGDPGSTAHFRHNCPLAAHLILENIFDVELKWGKMIVNAQQWVKPSSKTSYDVVKKEKLGPLSLHPNPSENSNGFGRQPRLRCKLMHLRCRQMHLMRSNEVHSRSIFHYSSRTSEKLTNVLLVSLLNRWYLLHSRMVEWN